jgi:hypothetical protein
VEREVEGSLSSSSSSSSAEAEACLVALPLLVLGAILEDGVYRGRGLN